MPVPFLIAPEHHVYKQPRDRQFGGCRRLYLDLFTNGNCTLNAVALSNSHGTAGEGILHNPLPGHRGKVPVHFLRRNEWRTSSDRFQK